MTSLDPGGPLSDMVSWLEGVGRGIGLVGGMGGGEDGRNYLEEGGTEV